MSLHQPLRAKIEETLAQVRAATAAGDVNGAVWSLLDAFAALGRDAAQSLWTLHYDSAERDDRMQEGQDELVFEALKSPWSEIYPELPGQIQGVLCDAFDDEHFRLEDPEGWAVVNADLPTPEEKDR